MLPDNIYLPVFDDQYLDDKADCCSNQIIPLIPGIVQVHQQEL
jgi:hypothetical protein